VAASWGCCCAARQWNILDCGAAWLIARFVTDLAAWPVGGFAATCVYLTVSAGQLAVAQEAAGLTARPSNV
jgi:hypothetical protein